MDNVTVTDSASAQTNANIPSAPPRAWARFDWHSLILLLIILVGAFLRLYNIAWDQGLLAHPDELSTTAIYAPTIHWPPDLKTALDPRQSPLNPLWDVGSQTRRSYTYGHLPLYVLVGAANGLHELGLVMRDKGVTPQAAEALFAANRSPGVTYVGRMLMALADAVTIYLVYLIARRLYGKNAGLLAAAFSAFTVLQIQLAHFFAVDSVSATFTLLALYGAMRMARERTAGAAVMAGLGAGLAVACKFSAAPIALAPIVAAAIAARRAAQEGQARPWGRALRHLFIAGLVALVSFVITSPYVLLDFENFWYAVVTEQGAMVSGAADMPFTRQYRGTLPYLYFIEQQARWGMGWPLGIVALAGFVWAIVRALRGRALPGEYIILSWIVPYFGLTGLFLAKFMRYMIPVTPLWVIFGAGMLFRWKVGRLEGGQQGEETWPPRSSAPLLLRSFISYLPTVAIILALVGAIVWSLAFVNGVYGTPHTWTTASRWIYDHVPDGSVICAEHWDRELPMSLSPSENQGARGYRIVTMPMYEPDTAQKYNLIRSMLGECDYVALSTNRLYRSIPNLPQRYPMSTHYYELLFDQALGFDEVARFETPPRLGPLVFHDQAADESFTVYDHPMPIIFAKTRSLTDAEWQALLGDSWLSAIHYDVGELPLIGRLRAALTGSDAPSPSPPKPVEETGLLLDEPVGDRPVVDALRWNTFASNSPLAAVLIWWLAVDIVALAAWPLTYTIFYRLRDRGHLLSKSLGLVILGYLVWLPSSLRLLRNGLPLTLAALGLLVALSLYLFYRRRHEMLAFWRDNVRLLLLEEGLFALAFLAFVWIRVLNPDLWQPWFGGEKSMEIAYINATLKSAYLPPHDPYFAHGYLNYYYYGQFLMTLLMRLTGIAPKVAFNLSVPLLFALTVSNAFTVAYNLTVRHGERLARTAGLVAAGLIALIGNLAGALKVIIELAGVSGSSFESNVPGLQYLVRAATGLFKVLTHKASLNLVNYRIYWDPTRVIPDTINEFPFFSFLFADLHPHLINIPFTLLFIALLLQITARSSRLTHHASLITPHASPPLWQKALSWAALPLVLGAVAVINTWDLPTAAGLLFLTLFVVRWPWKGGWGNLILSGLLAGVMGALALILYRPFFVYYKTVALGGVGLTVTRAKTPPGPFLAIWGLFLFLALSFILIELQRRGRWPGALRYLRLLVARWETLPRWSELYSALVRRRTTAYQALLWGLILLIVAAVALALLDFPVPALLLLPVALTALLLLRWQADAQDRFIGALVFTGLLVLLGVEIFYLQDHLDGGAAFRMNTLFKFYIQIWILLGLGLGAALPGIWNTVERWRSTAGRSLWTLALSLLLAGSLVYPILATPARVRDRFPGERPPVGTLDGLAFMTVGRFTWPDENHPIELKWDYEAIRWLQDNVAGTPVVAEAALAYYREHGGRVASYTGLPMLLGHHQQGEQRWGSQTGPRSHQVDVLFNGVDLEAAKQVIQELYIRYIYIGQLERNYYDAAGLAKFERLAQQGYLRIAYRNEGTTIYEVVE